MRSLFVLCVLCYLILRPFVVNGQEKIIINDSLWVLKIKPNVLQHVTQQYYPAFGRFTSNGLIYVDENEAIVLDSPYSVFQSEQLLNWFDVNYPDVKIVGIVVNHFHEDALGGLSAFHRRKIPSYSHRLTRKLLKADQHALRPMHTFNDELILKVGSSSLVNYYFGEAHAPDNIVSYLPREKVLFGGCMLKALNASKGNLSDANLKEWPITVAKVRKRIDAEYVIPGHGDGGGVELLDYTIKLFSENLNNAK